MSQTEPQPPFVDERLAHIPVPAHTPPIQPFRFIDLFAGIGGMRKAFESIGGSCVFTSESNPFSIRTYQANFQCRHSMEGDIRMVPAESVSAHDVLLAGFPCQPFSIAGVTKKNSQNRPHGFACEVQGTLFFDVARMIAYHQPNAFLLENVKNLVRHDQGRTFRTILDTLSNELGYHIHYKVIDAKAWVPQHRERIYIAGFRGNTGFTFNDLKTPDPEHSPKLSDILHPEDGSECMNPDDMRYLLPSGRVQDRYTLSEKLWTYLQSYAERHRLKGNGFGYGIPDRNGISRTLSARYHKDGSEILISKGQNTPPRRLTPRECSRLMGFDGPCGSDFIIPVSDTQAYRQFGNAVVVPVVQTIARHMKPWITAESDNSLQTQTQPISANG